MRPRVPRVEVQVRRGAVRASACCVWSCVCRGRGCSACGMAGGADRGGQGAGLCPGAVARGREGEWRVSGRSVARGREGARAARTARRGLGGCSARWDWPRRDGSQLRVGVKWCRLVGRGTGRRRDSWGRRGRDRGPQGARELGGESRSCATNWQRSDLVGLSFWSQKQKQKPFAATELREIRLLDRDSSNRY